MVDLSFSEMFMIVLAIVILFGPKKLPQIARDLGSGVRKMRGAVEDIKTEILKETDNPVSEIKKEIDKVKKSAQEFDPKKLIEEEKLDQTREENRKLKEDQLKDSYEGPVSR